MVRARSRRTRLRRSRPPAARAPRAAVSAAAVALLAGCGIPLPPEAGVGTPSNSPASPSVPGPAPAAGPPTVAEVEQAESDLGDAAIAAQGSGAGYERDEFGSSWADTDDNGCPTRHDVLARDLHDIRVTDDCTVVRGVLEDPYTGERVEFSAEDPMGVQIDHVVPLALAWRTGARE